MNLLNVTVSSLGDNLMNCLPVCLSMFMIRSSTGSCGVGVVRGKRHSLGAPRSTQDPLVVSDSGSELVKLSSHLSYSATLKDLYLPYVCPTRVRSCCTLQHLRKVDETETRHCARLYKTKQYLISILENLTKTKQP